MSRYIALCLTCKKKAARIKGSELTYDEEEEALFETSHSINATEDEIKEALICPRCQGKNCVKTFRGYQSQFYFRGHGYLDKAGAKRDMNLYHLDNQDPYSEMRQPGEVEDLRQKIKRAGKKGGKGKKHLAVRTTPKDMEKAVRQATSQGPV